MIENTIYYATSNHGKIAEVRRYCKAYAPHIKVEQFAYDLPELQTLDQLEVAAHKAETAWSILQKPVVVDDSGLFIDRYKGFPGVMSKYAMQALGLAGFMRLIDDQEPAHFTVTIACAYGPGQIKTFQGRCNGNLIKIDKMPESDNLPYSNFFIPEGHYQPYAQFRGTPAERLFGPRHKALDQFFAWYTAQKPEEK